MKREKGKAMSERKSEEGRGKRGKEPNVSTARKGVEAVPGHGSKHENAKDCNYEGA